MNIRRQYKAKAVVYSELFALCIHDFVVDVPQQVLTQKLLDTKGVFILDCYADVFIWSVLK